MRLGIRKAPPASTGWSMIEQMADVTPTSPRSPTRTMTTSSRSSLSRRDTGFPEGFCGNRNTSLPHPNANLSPDACITEDDIAITRALARHRMSFIAQKEKQHRMNRSMALNAIEETENLPNPPTSSSSMNKGFLAGGRDPSFSTIGRLALSSLHGAEFRRHLRRPSSSNGSNASDESMGLSATGESVQSEISSPPESPRLNRDGVSVDPRDSTKDPRDGRVPGGLKRKGSFWRLMHR